MIAQANKSPTPGKSTSPRTPNTVVSQPKTQSVLQIIPIPQSSGNAEAPCYKFDLCHVSFLGMERLRSTYVGVMNTVGYLEGNRLVAEVCTLSWGPVPAHLTCP